MRSAQLKWAFCVALLAASPAAGDDSSAARPPVGSTSSARDDVEPDDPDSLAEGILQIAKDSSLADEFGRKGSEGVRAHYNVARMADRALEVYASLSRRSADAATAEVA